MEGAKDPDEYIIKYGNARFQTLIDKALSVIEFKVKILKQNLNLDITNDKIKFLNEIAKLISKVDNTIEKEVYIEKISKEYQISKEAIYAEVNKLAYGKNKSEKILDKEKAVIKHQKVEKTEVSELVKKRENTVLALLLMGDLNVFKIIKQNITIEDFKDNLSDEEQNHITAILADDYEINNIEKAIDDIMQSYEKDKLNERKFQILEMLETPIEENQKKELEKELSEIIIHLAKIK